MAYSYAVLQRARERLEQAREIARRLIGAEDKTVTGLRPYL